MERVFFVIGALAGALAVAAGAFGAHALGDRLPPDRLATFETGARYLMVHALAMLALGLALGRWPAAATWLQASGWLFLAGMLLFSGSLFLLSLTGIRWLGAITPLGGVAFIAGWVCLAVAVLRQ
ncbi:MAG: DUF423 domain-containing protein [Anaerolineales bacterium]|nr:DUF423 domain-containing protein [Anaerolineales bacterium]